MSRTHMYRPFGGRRLQKLLFSATLSHDPEQLAALDLVFPRLFVADASRRGASRGGKAVPAARVPHEIKTVDDGLDGTDAVDACPGAPEATDEVQSAEEHELLVGDYSGVHYHPPETLAEHMVVCGAASKPLVLLYFLITKNFARTLIFTQSRDTTHRLCVLLNCYEGLTAEEFSATLSSRQRRSIIERFNSGQLQV